MTQKLVAGEYIIAWCTRCKLELGHTIVAMVGTVPKRVMCNTCNGEHNYRSGAADSRRITSSHKKRKTALPEVRYNEYMSQLPADRSAMAKVYTTKANYEKDDVVDHPKFGKGFVVSVINRNKIEIFFKDGPRLLAQNL